jgi:hypothetical protein
LAKAVVDVWKEAEVVLKLRSIEISSSTSPPAALFIKIVQLSQVDVKLLGFFAFRILQICKLIRSGSLLSVLIVFSLWFAIWKLGHLLAHSGYFFFDGFFYGGVESFFQLDCEVLVVLWR